MSGFASVEDAVAAQGGFVVKNDIAAEISDTRRRSLGNGQLVELAEYTVHGDTVNTAARIESMTKTIGRPILLADSTRDALLRAQEDLEHVGEFEVRGRESTVSLWTVEGTSWV